MTASNQPLVPNVTRSARIGRSIVVAVSVGTSKTTIRWDRPSVATNRDSSRLISTCFGTSPMSRFAATAFDAESNTVTPLLSLPRTKT